MKNCRWVKNKIVDYTSNLLSAQETAEYKDHVSQCPRCSDYLKETLSVQDMVTNRYRIETEEKTKEAVEEKTEERVKEELKETADAMILRCIDKSVWPDYESQVMEKISSEEQQRLEHVLLGKVSGLKTSWWLVSPVYQRLTERIATELTAAALVVSGIAAYVVNGGLNYPLQTYIYLLKHVW